MKLDRIFGRILGLVFGLAGAALMIGTVVLAFKSLNAPVKLAQVPQEAVDCSVRLMDAVAAGDYETVGDCLYGQPSLGADRQPEDAMGQKVWQAFLSSISYEFSGDWYATDAGMGRDAVITTLDLSAATDGLKDRVQAGLNKKVAEAEDMTELYDDSGSFREALVMEVLDQAVDDTLKKNTQTVSRQVTLSLVFREGRWWVVPDQALLQAISGNMAG